MGNSHGYFKDKLKT